MPYLDTNDIDLAIGFVDYINTKMFQLRGYKCAKFFSRTEKVYIDKYGKYRVGLNCGQSEALDIDPESGGGGYTEDEIVLLLTGERG